VDGDKYVGGGRHGLVHVGGEAAAAAALNALWCGDRILLLVSRMKTTEIGTDVLVPRSKLRSPTVLATAKKWKVISRSVSKISPEFLID
jgi:hypothetical protein